MGRRIHFEKRKSKRLSTVILADLYTLDMKAIQARGCITDISVGGMQIETNEPIDVQGEFAMTWYLPNGMSFRNIRGEIRRTAKETFTYVYGIQFTNIRFYDRLRIWWYITTR